ncbi:hypothetical protein FKP32DRAFT_456732 [Trametes sanguinea]|nr:hypothetical protein FKP32DRAFT_456732 [Trametes sanguinea]
MSPLLSSCTNQPRLYVIALYPYCCRCLAFIVCTIPLMAPATVTTRPRRVRTCRERASGPSCALSSCTPVPNESARGSVCLGRSAHTTVDTLLSRALVGQDVSEFHSEDRSVRMVIARGDVQTQSRPLGRVLFRTTRGWDTW